MTDPKWSAAIRRLQVWINPWITNVTAEAFKLARLSWDKGWLYAAHVQTWKGELIVQLTKGGKKMPIGQTKELIEILCTKVLCKDQGNLDCLLHNNKFI